MPRCACRDLKKQMRTSIAIFALVLCPIISWSRSPKVAQDLDMLKFRIND